MMMSSDISTLQASSPQDVEENSPPAASADGVVVVDEAQRKEDVNNNIEQRKEPDRKQSMSSSGGPATVGVYSVQFSDVGTPSRKDSSISRRHGPPLRMSTTTQFGIPYGFFESRAEFHTWGVEDKDLVDPSIQPIPPNSIPPKPFRVSLPGYTEKQTAMLLKKQKAQQRNPNFGPEVSTFPPTIIPSCKPNPNFVKTEVGYNWNDLPPYSMDKLPYAHAYFNAVNPEQTNMYEQQLPWCAYPYGVPAVEINEKPPSMFQGSLDFPDCC